MSYVLVSYDKDNGFGGIIKSLFSKKVSVSSEEQIGFKNLFDNYEGTSKLDQYTNNFGKLAKQCGVAKKEFADFLAKTQESGTVYNTAGEALKGYEGYLQSVGKSSVLTALKTKILSGAMKAISSIGWMALITVATTVLTKAWQAIDENIIHKSEHAKESIDDAISSYESSKSDLESLNSELQTTQDKINDLESKDALTFTEQSELDNLKAQNNELERSIQLQEAKKNAKLKSTISTVTDDYDDYRSDFANGKVDKKIQKYKNQINEAKINMQNAKDVPWDSQKSYDKYIDKQQKKIDEAQKKIDSTKADLTKNAEDIEKWIAKFDELDYKNLNDSQKETYNQMKSDLDSIYETSLSKGEYTEWKIQPVFEKGKLKDVKDQILQYFSDGGTIDGLADKFGDDIMQAIRQACDKNGVAFSDVINSLYAEATDNLSADALKKKLGTSHNVNSAYEAKQYNQDKEVNNYIDSLSAKDRQILATIDFDEDVTVENLKKALAEAQDEADQETITSNINFTADTATAKSAMSSLTDALADYKENGLEKMDISKLQALNNEDTFGNINGSTQDLEDFLSVMNDVNSTADQVQDAFDSLASAYLYDSQMAEQVTEETLGATQAQLEQMGVINAQEVAYQMLINKEGALTVAAREVSDAHLKLGNTQLTAKNAADELSNATTQEIANLIGDANAAGSASMALLQVANTKLSIGTLQTSADIDNLIALCTQLGITIESLQEYKSLISMLGDDPYTNVHGNGGGSVYAMGQQIQGKKANFTRSINAQIRAKTKTQTGGNTTASTKGGNNKSNSKTKSTKTEIDWLERAMTRVGKQIDSFKAKLENLFTIDTKSNNIAKQLELVNKQVAIATKQVSTYDKKVDNAKSWTTTKTVKKNGKKGKVKAKHTLSKSIMDKIANGDYSSTKLKDLISKYGQKKGNAISKVQDWYDKARDAEQKLDELQTTQRELQEQQYQLYVDEAQAKLDMINAQKDIQNQTNGDPTSSYEKQNQLLDSQKAIYDDLYNYQIKIAELTKDQNKIYQLQAEHEKQIRDIEKEKFENIKEDYSNRIALIDAEADTIQSRMDQIEARGQIVGASYYESQIAYKNQDKAKLQAELSSLQGQLALMEQAGDVGTKNWYDAKSAITDVQKQILDCDTSILNMNNSITEVANTIYDKVIAGMKKFSTEADFMVGLMDDLESFDELSHTITDVGLVNLGSYFTGKESSAKQAEITKSIVEQMKSNLANGDYSYIDALGYKRIYQSKEQMQDAIDSFYENWRDQINQTKEYNSKIIDFMRNKLQEELAAVQDLIDAKKEALSAEKDLHDYQKSITESTKNIGTIQAQITALQGDSSESAQARIQALQSQLEDAQDDLAEKQYERQISDQQDMLDNMYNKYSDLITAESQDTKALVEKGQKLMDSNMQTIKTTMDAYATDYGYTYQDLTNIFDADSFKGFSEGLGSKLQGVIDGLTNVKTATEATTKAVSDIQLSSSTTVNSDGSQTIDSALNHVTGGGQIQQSFTSSNTGSSSSSGGWNSIGIGVTIPSSLQQLSDTAQQTAQHLADQLKEDKAKEKKTTTKKSSSKKSAKKKKGHSRGGIIKEEDLYYSIKSNGDTGLASVNPGEEILTKYDSDSFRQLINSDLVQKPDIFDNLVKANLPDFSKIGKNTGNNVTNGDITFEFNMPNVTDSKSMLHALQTDKTLQNAVQDLTIGQINRTSRLGINKYR